MKGYDPRQYQALIERGLITEDDHLCEYGPDPAGVQHWSLTVDGPYQVGSRITSPEWPDEELGVEVQIGQLRVSLSYEGAQALAHTLLASLSGPRAAAALMTVAERLPESLEHHAIVSRLLWRATDSWAHLWPQRGGGYNDAAWGCRVPEGVPYRQPSPGTFFEPPAEPGELWKREAPDAQLPPPEPPKPPGGPDKPPGGPRPPRKARMPRAA